MSGRCEFSSEPHLIFLYSETHAISALLNSSKGNNYYNPQPSTPLVRLQKTSDPLRIFPSFNCLNDDCLLRIFFYSFRFFISLFYSLSCVLCDTFVFSLTFALE